MQFAAGIIVVSIFIHLKKYKKNKPYCHQPSCCPVAHPTNLVLHLAHYYRKLQTIAQTNLK